MCPHMDAYDFDDDEQQIPPIRGLSRSERRKKTKKKQQNPGNENIIQDSTAQLNEDTLTFTYQASRYEAGWLEKSLGGFYQQHWIQDVLRLIKGGKEASVYQCLADESSGQKYLAAKVYRPRQFRNLKNDHLYREGRDYLDENGHIIHDKRASYAIQKKSSYGLKLSHASWIEHEVKTMQILLDAGADIPVPHASADNAILMTFFGDDFTAAPTLNEVSINKKEAKSLFDRVLFNVELMLANHRVHADLSAYNILYWEGEICLIDFPQAIDPRQNLHAWPIFLRDVTRVCQYFSKFGIESDSFNLASDIWEKNGFSLSSEIDPHFLKEMDPFDHSL
ncbi:MAG: hypothetical protein CL609_00675 [Anaerolineaceae bacterium]|nr:hypothetical protein [Anaerolineaceae bacterium]